MNESIVATEMVFWVCAVGGTTFFVLRVALMLFAGIGDLDAEMDGDVGDLDAGHDLGADGDVHSDMDGSNVAFKLLSLNAITGFFMMFGWVGLAGFRQYGWGSALSTLAGSVAGIITMFLTGLLFQQARRLVSSGANFKVSDTLNLEGSVYTRIPAQGRGKVNIVVGDLTRELDAVSEDGVDIDSFVSVRVVRIVDGITVSVRSTKETS